MNLKTILSTAAATVAFGACADEFVWPEGPTSEGVLVLETSDTKSDNSSLEFTGHWSAPNVLDSQYHYWVPSDKTIYGSKTTTLSFVGKSLTVEGLFRGANSAPNIPQLRFLAGSRLGFYNDRNGIGNTAITIVSTSDNPVTFFHNKTEFKERPTFGADTSFVSDANSWLVMKNDQETPRLIYGFSGCDFSQFYGTLKLLRDREDVSVENYLTNLVTKATSMPGSYILGRGVTLALTKEASCIDAANFTAESGSRIYKKSTVPVSTVTGKLTLGDAVEVVASAYTPPELAKYDTEDVVLFRLKDAAAQSANLPSMTAIKMADDGYNYYGWPQCGLQDDSDVSGTKLLAFRSGRPLCTLLEAAESEDSGKVSTFTNTTKWSTGALPTSEQNAIVDGKRLDVAKDFTEYAFAAGGMVVAGGDLNPMCAVLTVTNLFLVNGDVFVTDKAVNVADYKRREMNTTRITGEFMGVYGPVSSRIRTQSARLLVVDYPVSGEGALELGVRTAGSYPYGGIELTRANVMFAGKTIVRGDGNSKCDSATGYRLQMYLNDARNLGGDMAVATYDGITVRGDAMLISTNSLCFNQKNRHFYVADRARIVMQHPTDNTFDLQVPVTYNGELVFGNDYPTASKAKVGKGGGTLVLGGAAKFYDEANQTAGDTPVADKNKLTMLIGKLNPADAEALNGVAVTFGAESEGLVVDYANEALRTTTGFKQTKAGSALTKAEGQIPVTFVNLPTGVPSVRNIAVCTVPRDDAATVCAKLKGTKVEGLGRPTLRVVPNNDGVTSTIMADIQRMGVVIVFR